jgi:hypothetical protein
VREVGSALVREAGPDQLVGLDRGVVAVDSGEQRLQRLEGPGKPARPGLGGRENGLLQAAAQLGRDP